MYAWIWRKLPFGLWGKISGSVLIAATIGTLLWLFVFPAVEPMLTPFDDVQVGDPNGGYSDISDVTPSSNPGDHEIPYATQEPATPSPSPSKKR